MVETKKRNSKGAPLEETSSQRILLEEYRLLEERYIRIRNEAVTRMNFFITAASLALSGVVVFASGKDIDFIYSRIVLLVVLYVLSTIGLDIFFFLISRDIESDASERGLARIRHYFVALDPSIEPYFMSNTADVPTRYIVKKLSGIRTAAQIIESFLLGLSLTISYTFWSMDVKTLLWVGGIAAILLFIILEVIARTLLSAAVKNVEADVRFRS